MYFLLALVLLIVLYFAWSGYRRRKQNRELDERLKKWVQWKQEQAAKRDEGE